MTIGRNDEYISDIFNRYSAIINWLWNARKLGGKFKQRFNLEHTCINIGYINIWGF